MFILGQPKDLSELKPVSMDEINGLAAFLNDQIKQGTPLEVPQAMPLMDLARLIKTLQDIHTELQNLKQSTEDRPRLILPPMEG